MKRAGHLFDRIVGWDNLRVAVGKALRGKRNRTEVRAYTARLDHELRDLRQQLAEGTIILGRSHQFVIHDPKRRIITAPCFRERVLHHAIMNICEPIFERWLIHDTYACRRGKGRIAAVERAARFNREHEFFLKIDIKKYFDSIPHQRLLDRLARLFKEPRLLRLFEGIVRSFRGNLGQGVPIGSLTSQHWANFYLGWFDRAVKEHCRIRGYVRYMDDMVLWRNTQVEMRAVREFASNFLRDELHLEPKQLPYSNHCAHGVDFLGCRIDRSRVRLNRRSRVRFRRKLLGLERDYRTGQIGELELQQRGTSLMAFTRAAATCSWQFRQHVLQQSEVNGL